jgi:hypothetical protein
MPASRSNGPASVWHSAIISADPRAAVELDWLIGRPACDLLVGVTMPAGADNEAASLQCTMYSISQEVAAQWALGGSCNVMLVLITRGVSELQASTIVYFRNLQLWGDLFPRRNLADGAAFIHASARRIDLFEVLGPLNASLPLSPTRPPRINVLLLTPTRDTDDSTQSAWLMRAVATRVRPRYTLSLRVGTVLTPGSLWRMFAEAECAGARCAAIVGSKPAPRNSLAYTPPLHPYAAALTVQAAGSESADALCAAVPLPYSPDCPVLFRWGSIEGRMNAAGNAYTQTFARGKRGVY